VRAVLLRCLALGALAIATIAASPPIVVGPKAPVATTTIYVVRSDPRACPSPVCGGYWVALANHARTQCSDGNLRSRCYVAVVADAEGKPLRASLPTNGLARATLGSHDFGRLGTLGALFVAEAWAPADRSQPRGGFYRLRDIGIRCVRAPCFSYRASRLNSRASAIRVSAVSLGHVGADPEVARRARAAFESGGGLLAAGTFGVVPRAGRVFRAAQVYLKP